MSSEVSMRTVFCCCLLLWMFVGLAVHAADAAPTSTPINTNVSDPEVLPVFLESVPFHTVITVQNPYDKAVKVGSIDSTCTCSTLHLADYFLLPHATTTLEIGVDNTNRSARERLGVSLYLTDPALEPIEIVAFWDVRAHVAVDSHLYQDDITTRPVRAFRDIYRYPSKARPDELHRLSKRVRFWSPPEEIPTGGLQVESIEAPGPIWAMTAIPPADGSVLLEATGRKDANAPDGISDETIIIHTNHPKKPRIELVFSQYVGKDAGSTVFDPHAKPDLGK